MTCENQQQSGSTVMFLLKQRQALNPLTDLDQIVLGTSPPPI